MKPAAALIALLLYSGAVPGPARAVPITKEQSLERAMPRTEVVAIFGPAAWQASLGPAGTLEYRTYVATPTDGATKAMRGLASVMTLGTNRTYDDALGRTMAVHFDRDGRVICADRHPLPVIGEGCTTDRRRETLDQLMAGNGEPRRDYHRLIRRVDTAAFAPEVMAFDDAQKADEPIAHWNAGVASDMRASRRKFRQYRLCHVAAQRMMVAALRVGEMGKHGFWSAANDYFGSNTYFLAGALKVPFDSIAPMIAEDRKTLGDALNDDYYDPASNIVDCQTTYAREACRVAKERDALLDRVP